MVMEGRLLFYSVEDAGGIWFFVTITKKTCNSYKEISNWDSLVACNEKIFDILLFVIHVISIEYRTPKKRQMKHL